MKQKRIVPRPGMIIPLPDGNGNLPAEGKVLTLSTYWYKRLADGDVEFQEPGTAAPGRKNNRKKANHSNVERNRHA